MVVRYLSHALFSLESCDVHWTVIWVTRPEGARGCTSSSPRLADPPVLPALLKGHQSGINNHGPLADALCVAQVAWLLIFLQETGWDEAISSQLCRAKHSKFMSSWSWDQVEQDGHIGTSARTSFDKLSIVTIRAISDGRNSDIPDLKSIPKLSFGNMETEHCSAFILLLARSARKRRWLSVRHPTRHKIGLWLSGLNHTIPFCIFFIYINWHGMRCCEKVDRNAGKRWF